MKFGGTNSIGVTKSASMVSEIEWKRSVQLWRSSSEHVLTLFHVEFLQSIIFADSVVVYCGDQNSFASFMLVNISQKSSDMRNGQWTMWNLLSNSTRDERAYFKSRNDQNSLSIFCWALSSWLQPIFDLSLKTQHQRVRFVSQSELRSAPH